MSAILPLAGLDKQLARKSGELDIPADNSDIQIHHGMSLSRHLSQPVIQIRPRQVVMGGKRIEVDPYQLIRLIKRVTQNIGEYKDLDDIYSAIICGSLRKARGDLVNILETEFRIHWEIDARSGKSVFYM